MNSVLIFQVMLQNANLTHGLMDPYIVILEKMDHVVHVIVVNNLLAMLHLVHPLLHGHVICGVMVFHPI